MNSHARWGAAVVRLELHTMLQVGACIVGHKKVILGIGYNGAFQL